MAIDTVAPFVEALRQSRLLDPDQLEEVARVQSRTTDPRALAKALINKGWLTAYQVNQVFQGQAAGLALGQYRILERLGEGGMGQVFKARHAAMGRVVALKVIRKERLENAEAVKRFQREVRAAAQLNHPNIVMAFDADQVNGTYFLAMEYVEGIDLAQLVKDKGPLPVARACDFIRQAAQGLQFAHERGMVHRDIKPANLLLGVAPEANGTPQSSDSSPNLKRRGKPLVKVLDMGLARIDVAEPQDESLTALSVDGRVMGTPDFMAPEQAKDSHKVDHRADIYSLGCTLHFLLTRQPLFPGGTQLEKFIKHQMDPPPPVQTLRKDVPDGVSQVLARMLAKRPEDRYQSAAEVAAALAPFCEAGARGADTQGVRAGLPTAAARVPAAAMETPVAAKMTPKTGQFRKPLASLPRPLRGRRKPVVLAAIIFLVLGFVFLMAWAMSPSPAKDSTAAVASAATTAAAPTSSWATSKVATAPKDAPPPPIGKRPFDGPAFPLVRLLPENTNALVSIQVNELLRSQVFRKYQDQIKLPLPELRQVFSTFRIDLDHEVHRVVVAHAGSGKQEDFFLIVLGSFDVEKVRDAARRAAAHVKQASEARGPLSSYYEFVDEKDGKRTYGAVLGPSGAVALAGDEQTLTGVLDRLNGLKKGLSFRDKDLLRLLEQQRNENRPTVQLLAGGTTPFGGNQQTMFEVIGVRTLALNLNMSDAVAARCTCQCKDAFTAGLIKGILAGLLKEAGKKNREVHVLAQVLEGIVPELSEDKMSVMLEHTFTPAEIDRILKAGR